MPNDCETLLLLWRLHQTGKSSGSVYFFPVVVGIACVPEDDSLPLYSWWVMYRGWMGNWLHTKVIKAYWSRHLLSILRLSTDLLYISSEKGCCSGVPCQPSHLLLLVFYVPHAIFTFLQEWASSVVNADSVYYDRKQIKYCSDSFGCRCWLYWLTISFFMRFYYPNGCDRHSTRIITTKTAVDVSQIYEPYGSLHCHVWS